jgi:hypothetical protein
VLAGDEGYIEFSGLSDGQTSVLERIVTVDPGTMATVDFIYKVSSEEGHDFLKFYIDGVEITSVSGIIDWNSSSTPLSVGTHTLRWEYSKDMAGSAGRDAAWLDMINVDIYKEQLIDFDTGILQGLTFDDEDWYFAEVDGTGDLAMRNYDQTRYTDHWLYRTVKVPPDTSVEFDWKITTSQDCYGAFYVDSTNYSGNVTTVDWSQRTYSLPQGTHTLKWRSHEGTGTMDMWVDNIRFIDDTGKGFTDEFEFTLSDVRDIYFDGEKITYEQLGAELAEAMALGSEVQIEMPEEAEGKEYYYGELRFTTRQPAEALVAGELSAVFTTENKVVIGGDEVICPDTVTLDGEEISLDELYNELQGSDLRNFDIRTLSAVRGV